MMGWLHKYCEQIRRNNREFINLIFRRRAAARRHEMSNKQLVALDRNTGEIFEIGALNHEPEEIKDGVFIGAWGKSTNHTCAEKADYPLTPLPLDDELHLVLRLGREVLDSVGEEDRSRVVAYRRAVPGEFLFSLNTGSRKCDYDTNAYPILAPEQPPTRVITIPGICDNAEMSESTYQSIKKQLGKEER